MKRRHELQHHRFKLFFKNHHQAAIKSLERLRCHRWSALFTCSVIALTLTLPLMLFIFVKNINLLTDKIENVPKITLYLDTTLTPENIDNLINQFSSWPKVGKINYISPEEGLKHLVESVGIDSMLHHLKQNPLPPVLEITLAPGYEDESQMNAMVKELKGYKEIQEVQYDIDWVKRLFAFIFLIKSITLGIGIILGIGVILIVGNTIKFAIEQYRQEIEVFKMIGASNAMIRRPFLYMGIYYGLFGALLAFLIVVIFMVFLSSAVNRLASAFASSFNLQFFSSVGLAEICLLGMVLGLIGAFVVVKRNIYRTEEHL